MRQRSVDLSNQLRINQLVIQDMQDAVLVVDGGRVVADDAPGPAVAHYRRLVDAGPG